MRILIPIALLSLSACATMERQFDREGQLVDSPARDWHMVATEADRTRLREWRSAFVGAVRTARAAGDGASIDGAGALLRPDAALPGPAIPNGDYRCRTIKVGAKSPGMMNFVAYPPFTCRMRTERGVQGLARLSGSQRPVGLLYPGDALRSVFLGTLMLGDETRAMQYGGDPDRDMAGYVERIGPRQWRLILPRPRYESQIDVIELVPAG